MLWQLSGHYALQLIEASLTQRVQDAQSALAACLAKEHLMNERLVTEQARAIAVEVPSTRCVPICLRSFFVQEKLNTARKELTRLQVQLETSSVRAQEAEAQLVREQGRLDSQRETYAQAMDEWQRDKALLEKKVCSPLMNQSYPSHINYELADEIRSGLERAAQQHKTTEAPNTSRISHVWHL